MRRLLAATTILALTVAPARAALVVDQDFLSSGAGVEIISQFSDGAGFRRLQTFTVGVTGSLARVDVRFLAPVIDPPAFAGLRVFRTLRGLPSFSPLFEVGPPTLAGDLASFTFAPVPVTTGEVFAIEPVGAVAVGWLGRLVAGGEGPYAGGTDIFTSGGTGGGGRTVINLTTDNHFRTWVEVAAVPAPPALALLAFGLLALGATRLAPRG